MRFRTLRADEIEVRVSTVNKNGVSLLLYKDARCDMNILDETVGPYNWKREHTRDNANCIVSIWDEKKGMWVSKEDTGTESYTEKEKGLASDSFKRACFNWGIGRELYTAPFIWIGSNNVTLEQGKNGKLTTRDRFKVVEIECRDKVIVKLKIYNDKKERVVYTYDSGERQESETPSMTNKIGQAKINVLSNEVERIGLSEEAILNRYKKKSYADFTEEEWLKLMPALKKMKGVKK